jgi:DNA gyrase/topoisomerase IV subunit A
MNDTQKLLKTEVRWTSHIRRRRFHHREMKTSYLDLYPCDRQPRHSDLRDGLKPVHRRILYAMCKPETRQKIP